MTIHSHVEAAMPSLSVIATVLLVAGAPTVVLAQASPSSNPAAHPETSTAAGKLNDQQIKTKLETQGYTGVRDILSTPKGITAKAMKGDKAMTVVMDSSGKVIQETPTGP
jgi:hypothetical protein